MSFKLYERAIFTDDTNLAYWQAQSKYADTQLDSVGTAENLEWETVSLYWTRTTPTGTFEDRIMTSLAVAKILLNTGVGVIDDTDRGNVESALDTWWGSQKAQHPSRYTLDEYRWHHYTGLTDNPGPAVRVTDKNVAGTGASTNCLPDQVATSVTFITASRRHWGRMYLPALIYTGYNTTGRIGDTVNTAARFETLLEAIDTVDVGGTGVTPVVASKAYNAVMSIDVIQVDDIADVIRSRRGKQPAIRTQITS